MMLQRFKQKSLKEKEIKQKLFEIYTVVLGEERAKKIVK